MPASTRSAAAVEEGRRDPDARWPGPGPDAGWAAPSAASRGIMPRTGVETLSKQARPSSSRMRRAGDAIEHHADDLDVLPVAAEAVDQRRDRGTHAGDVDHQHHRQAEQGRDVGRDAGAVGGAVEQAHDPFADQEIAALPALLEQTGQGLEAHRPRVDIVGRPAGGAAVEGRVDIVRPDLERADGHAAPAQGRQHAQRQRGLAGAGGGAATMIAGRAHRGCQRRRGGGRLRR